MKLSPDKKRLKLYAWIGLAYFSLWALVNLSGGSGTISASLMNNIWRTVFLIIINYIFFEYLFPFILRKKHLLFKIMLSLVAVWMQMMFYSFGLYAWRSIGILLHVYTDFNIIDPESEDITDMAAYGVSSMLLFGIIRHLYEYMNLKASAQQLRIEKQEAELSYLKSQTNPHFLFNTLNNIYSLSRDKSDLAPESIMRLSQILRFMLYETGGEFISIEQELKIISDYIELEKSRYDDTLSVNFNYNIEDLKQAIPPLLLIPLVENAFKHGVSETRNQPFIDIHLSVNQRQLTFTVKNSSEKYPDEREVKESIGLSNLRRQLELLYKDYNLSVQQGDSVFVAILKINLASHV